jgi:hypothetical protein
MTRRAITILALALALVVVSAFALSQCQRAQTAGTAAKVARGQAGAAVESGSDAVDTVGNRSAADAATDQITRENDDAIRKADGAETPVAAPARDAGIAGLCRRRAYSGDPRCVQPPAAR